ncbi:MAG: YccF domain-containing protein [Bacteroidales bacterium]|nr:YccF domain-containing protein [Bacteroidales bacterium]MBP5795259.1 YccF domain-containing protein [Bacteroidales bacterium]
MTLIGNILWFVLGGFIVALLYFLGGLLMCVTIIGIPFGVQLIKIAGLAICPFGRDVEIMKDSGCLNTLFNILWLAFGWWWIALLHLALAAIFAVTIVGLPFARAHWRIMKLSMLPFGTITTSKNK